jgi:hypothetical protein
MALEAFTIPLKRSMEEEGSERIEGTHLGRRKKLGGGCLQKNCSVDDEKNFTIQCTIHLPKHLPKHLPRRSFEIN